MGMGRRGVRCECHRVTRSERVQRCCSVVVEEEAIVRDCTWKERLEVM
jgi:hypothetical protein